MQIPEPQPDTIDAWLAGGLSPEESAAMESFLQVHPETVEVERVSYDHCGLDPERLRGLPAEIPDSELAMLIARIKSGLSCATRAPDAEGWREIVTPSDTPGILGTLGGYDIIESLATGGMGIVLKADDPALKRFAAIKSLSPDAASNATARQRFLREARAAAQLEHENILPIYEVCEAAVPWFAMRFADGGNLQDRIEGGGIFDAKALGNAGRQIACALAAAHDRGMIHRDIKPSNILLERGGDRLWVADFGIVRCFEDPSLTYPGAIAGTPRFMSPEQAAGHDLDERSDLFSLGLVLFFCATGENLLAGKTTAAVLAELGSGKRFENLRKLESLPVWLRTMISHLLEHDRALRPASAREVIEAFESETATRRKRGPTRRWIAAAAVAAVLATGVGFLVKMAAEGDGMHGASGSVRIEETGQRFDDLAEALESVTAKATLELSGDLELSREIWMHHEVSLKGNPRSKPTVTIPFSGGHGIYFFQPFRMQGIRFVRSGPEPIPLPIVGSNVAQGRCEVEDCEFVLPPGMGGYGLGFTGTSDAIVRRCRFEANAGNGIFLATKGPETLTTTVRVEDCLFTGYSAFEIFAWSDPGEIRLAMTRCVVVADMLVLADRSDPMPTLLLDLEENKVSARFSMVLLRDVAPAANLDRLVWRGRGNVYFSPIHWLHAATSRRPRGDYEPLILKTREEFEATLPHLSESDAVERPLPTRRPERDSLTPGDLLRQLPLPSESPLRSSLEALEKNRKSD